MRYFTPKEGVEVQVFTSLSDVANLTPPEHGDRKALELFNEPMNTSAIRDPRRARWWDDAPRRSQSEINEEWFGHEDGVRGVMDVLENGWESGIKRAHDLIEKIDLPPLPSFRRTRDWGKDGHSLNLARVTNGASKPWRKMTKKAHSVRKTRDGNFTVVIDFGSNCNVGSDEHQWRGVVGIRIAEALIRSGRRVRILACMKSVISWSQKYVGAIIVKNYQDPIDFNQVLVPVALSGFLRTYGLRMVASARTFAMKSARYGVVGKLDVENDLKFLLDDSVPILVEDVWDEASAVNTLKTLKEKLA